MFIGMHWLWWSFWVFTLFAIAWAFVRSGADRSEAHKDVLQKEAAEDTLRRRFAAGEIDEEEYARRMKVLKET
jgi:putative membrane protein